MEQGLQRAEAGLARLTRAQAAAAGVQPGPRMATPRNRRRALPQIQSPAQSPAGAFWRPRRGRPRRRRTPSPQQQEEEEDEWGGIDEPDEPAQDDPGRDAAPRILGCPTQSV